MNLNVHIHYYAQRIIDKKIDLQTNLTGISVRFF